jgi:hypothetical protein
VVPFAKYMPLAVKELVPANALPPKERLLDKMNICVKAVAYWNA